MFVDYDDCLKMNSLTHIKHCRSLSYNDRQYGSLCYFPIVFSC